MRLKPRFTAGSVTGGATQAVRAGNVTWYVHDRAYCCRVVRIFGGNAADPETAARQCAARLNDLHETDLKGLR